MLLFQDEATVRHSPSIYRIWSLKGQQPEVLTPIGRNRQHLIGVVNIFTGQVYIAFAKALKKEQFHHFLEGILARHSNKRKVVLVTDNAPIHGSGLVKNFVKQHETQFELMFLPKYSPDLNPQENIWRKMRKTVTHNTYFKTFKEFQRALIRFFVKYKTPSQEIVSLCKYKNMFNAL